MFITLKKAHLGHQAGATLDIHEEPVSVAARQWLAAVPSDLPVVMYTAQNVDKRYPPPFAQYERAAHRRVAALYPCSRQAASVARGKGFSGLIEVLPLGFDDTLFCPGEQYVDDAEIVLGLVGRLVPEKGSRGCRPRPRAAARTPPDQARDRWRRAGRGQGPGGRFGAWSRRKA